MGKRRKYNKRKENRRQKKFAKELKIPIGQVRDRFLKQKDRELVLNQYKPISKRDSDKRVILIEDDIKKRYEDIDFGDAINKQKVSKRFKFRRKLDEKVDVVECHIYDTDDQLLKSVFVEQDKGWTFLNDGEKQYDKNTGKQNQYYKVIL